MDILSHGLWGGVFLPRDVWYLAFLIGILPDIISFGPSFLYLLKKRGFKFGKPEISSIPKHVFAVYNITHSIITVMIVFGIIYLLTEKFYIFMLAWPIHIIMDIPTHTKEFFPTKFMYPFSNFYINGFSWAQPWFLAVNYGLLVILYIFVF